MKHEKLSGDSPRQPSQERFMYEDDLPANMPRKDYDDWYAKSYVPGGVGVRVGPIYPGEQPKPCPICGKTVHGEHLEPAKETGK